MPFKLQSSSRLVTILLLALFIGVSLFVRIYYSYDAVFVGDWIKLTSNDAYYQMRLADLIAYNFPHISAFDPYLIYPGGMAYGPIHFFNWLIALVIWVVSLGNPTEHVINLVAVYFPVVLAALTVIPVYFIGKSLFNRWAGIIAAALIAVLPGEFVGRSILGGTDQHVAETLFSAVAAMFVIFAVRAAWLNKISWDTLIKRDWKAILKPLLYSLLAGLFMGIYLITWQGALLFVFIITVYYIAQIIIDHFKRQSGFYLGFTGFVTFLTAFLIFLPVPWDFTYKLSLGMAMLIPPVLAFLSHLMVGKKFKPYYFPIAMVLVAAIALVIFSQIYPNQFGTMISYFSIFNPGGPTGTTTIEMQPFLSPNGTFNIAVAWGNFTTSIFLIPWAPIPGFAIIALVILIVYYVRRGTDEKPLLFFFVWTLVILVATLTQRRFAYYLVVNMALLTGYIAWQAIWFFSRRRQNPENPETQVEQYRRSRSVGVVGGLLAFASSFLLLKITSLTYFFVPVFILGLLSIFYGFWAWVKLKGLNDYMMLWAFVFPLGIPVLAFIESQKPRTAAKNKEKKTISFSPAVSGIREVKTRSGENLNPWLYRFNIATLVVLVFVATFWLNYNNAKQVSAAATYAPSDAWVETLYWIRNNTPEPMDPENYYKSFDIPTSGKFDYPDTAYGVTAWWDYGYWITRTAQRLPNANPSQSPEPIKKVANLFLAEDPRQAKDLLQALDTEYVVLDITMTTSKLWAVMVWAGVDTSKYIQAFYYQSGNQLVPVEVYTPEYYRLLSVRLFNFNGKGTTTEKPMVLTWENKRTSTGQTVRVITNAQEFESYQAAVDYVNSHAQENLTIVGSSPFVSPVPVEAVQDFELVFSSTMNDTTSANSGTAEVKVFQYLGN